MSYVTVGQFDKLFRSPPKGVNKNIYLVSYQNSLPVELDSKCVLLTNVMRSYLGIMELRVMEIVSVDECAAYLAVDLPEEAVHALSNYHRRKYVVEQTSSEYGTLVLNFDTIEAAEEAIAQEIEVFLEKYPDYNQDTINVGDCARTILWKADDSLYCSFQRYWE